MSTYTTPPDDGVGATDGPDERPAANTRRGAARVRPDADLELMLALRGAAHARDLRNRVVRPRSAETRDVDDPGEAAAAAGAAASSGPDDDDAPRDLAHPN